MTSVASTRPAIMVVEDEFDVLQIFDRLLRELSRGYEIISVHRSVDALAYLAERAVPLVLTDYNMPGMNGLQLTRAIKAAAPDTRVILTTAFPTGELERQAREAGADYFLAKPLPLDELEQIIAQLLA